MRSGCVGGGTGVMGGDDTARDLRDLTRGEGDRDKDRDKDRWGEKGVSFCFFCCFVFLCE